MLGETIKPGGRLALLLFLSGVAILFVSALFGVMGVLASAVGGFGADGWVIPVWGLGATALGIVLRRKVSTPVRAIAWVWAMMGLALFMVVIFVTTASIG